MSRTSVIVRTLLVLAVVWTGVWLVRSAAGMVKLTAARIGAEVRVAAFDDWSQPPAAPDPAVVERRRKQLEKIANQIQRLDFQERINLRRDRTSEQLFARLSPDEQNRFVELTVMESIERFLDSLEALPPKQRKRFIEMGLRELGDEVEDRGTPAVNPLISGMIEQAGIEGIRAFVRTSNAATKFSLGPVVEAINESIQGIRGHEFGPPRHRD